MNIRLGCSCVQLAWAVGSDDPGAWSDLLSKMKEGIISTFDAHIVQREEEIRRSETQRQMPGWNFCTFFILKVCFGRKIYDDKSS